MSPPGLCFVRVWRCEAATQKLWPQAMEELVQDAPLVQEKLDSGGLGSSVQLFPTPETLLVGVEARSDVDVLTVYLQGTTEAQKFRLHAEDGNPSSKGVELKPAVLAAALARVAGTLAEAQVMHVILAGCYSIVAAKKVPKRHNTQQRRTKPHKTKQ